MILPFGRVALAVAAIASSRSIVDTPVPSSLTGTWDVERVLVDGQDQMHWGYRPNDPQFVGRELMISTSEVRFNGSMLGCKQSTWVPHATTWGYLIGKGFPRSPDGGRKATPVPADFELRVSKTAKATAYLLCPRPEDRESSFVSGTWLAIQDADSAALRIGSAALLILTRRPPTARPRASFPCEKAGTPTEKAICASFPLAAWDRSVAAAWRERIAADSGAVEQLRGEQKEWLSERDRCGADAQCLRDKMIQRVRDLGRW
jgi:hypothetical protein